MYIASDAQAVAHYPLTDAQLGPKQQKREKKRLLFLSKLSFCVMSYGMEYPFGHLKSSVLFLSLPRCLGALPCASQLLVSSPPPIW